MIQVAEHLFCRCGKMSLGSASL